MATSPTPSLDSIRGIETTFIEHNGYLSDSPLTLSGSSPPVSDSAICDDYTSTVVVGATVVGQHHPISASVSSTASSSSSSSASSSSSSSGLSGCGSTSSNTSNVSSNSGGNGNVNGGVGVATGSGGPVTDDLFGPLMPSPMRAQALMAAQHLQQQQQPQPTALYCHRHKNELLKFSCRTCCTLVCKDCITLDHMSGMHEIEHVQENGVSSLLTSNGGAAQCSPETVLQTVVADLRGKVGEIVTLVDNTAPLGDTDLVSSKIKMQYQRANTEVNETYQFFCSMLDERKQEMVKELENFYNAKMATYTTCIQRSKELVDKTLQTCDAMERSPKAHSISEILMLRKNLELQLQAAIQELQMPFELEFMSNYQSIQAGVRNTFGYVRASAADPMPKQPPIARPTQSISSASSHGDGSSNSSVTGGSHLPGGLGLPANLLDGAYTNGGSAGVLLGRSSMLNNAHTANSFEDLMTKRYAVAGVASSNNTNNSSAATAFIGVPVTNPYEKWSNGGSDNLFTSTTDPFTSAQMLNTVALTNGGAVCTSVTSTNVAAVTPSALNALNITSGNGVSSSDSLMDLTSKLHLASIYPPKSQIKRQKMIYHCKFGEFGVMEGQFTEPSGVAVNAQNDIIVADTNNHRIQIFDKEGRFKFQFGECGKRDSQLLYPNRVAVVRGTGDIIVTERSPTHQIQIYNQYGQFVRKFGANILQHPRGVTVDNKGRIIVVECKVMRVIIFDQNGNVLHKFGCSKHLEFPNGVVVNDKQEIFISDNRAHCVKVFNYDGQYLRQIGGEGITNYPIGVGINANGEILIADNHNNFNLTIFTQDGQLVSALESKVKHAQCFDVALMDDGSVVLASKDYRLYIYRYVQVPPIGL
uniref:B box-type domain-containing protein n=1 Tax=Glossina morsitans morsitans TaxID=37546 RepID=A0A1B0FEZ7_GLOMM